MSLVAYYIFAILLYAFVESDVGYMCGAYWTQCMLDFHEWYGG